MTFSYWSERNASLNALDTAVQNETRHLIDDLSIDLLENEHMIVRGTARTHYGVQLLLLTMQRFGRETRFFGEIHLSLRIGDRTLELAIPCLKQRAPVEFVSTSDVNR